MEENENKLKQPRKVLQVDIKPEILEKAEIRAKEEGYKSLAEKVRVFLIRETTKESSDFAYLSEQEIRHVLSNDAIAVGCTTENLNEYVETRISTVKSGGSLFYNGKLVRLLHSS